MGSITYLAIDHIKDEYDLIKLGKQENNHIIGYKYCQNLISLLIYEDHVMLYDVNITFNCRYYMNTWHLLESLIKDNTLVRMTVNQKQTLLDDIERF